jgi:phosphocarrier protein HPr
MVKLNCKVNNPMGLTSRYCAELVAEANRANKCSLTLKCDEGDADLKSIMNMMSLVIKAGSEFTIEINGEDEESVKLKFEKLLLELKLLK